MTFALPTTATNERNHYNRPAPRTKPKPVQSPRNPQHHPIPWPMTSLTEAGAGAGAGGSLGTFRLRCQHFRPASATISAAALGDPQRWRGCNRQTASSQKGGLGWELLGEGCSFLLSAWRVHLCVTRAIYRLLCSNFIGLFIRVFRYLKALRK